MIIWLLNVVFGCINVLSSGIMWMAALFYHLLCVHHYSWSVSDTETQVHCVFIESLKERRAKGSQRGGTLGGIDPSSFLICTPLSVTHAKQKLNMSNKLFIILIHSQWRCSESSVWRLCEDLEHLWSKSFPSTSDRCGCGGVMSCTVTVQVYTLCTEVILSCSVSSHLVPSVSSLLSEVSALPLTR